MFPFLPLSQGRRAAARFAGLPVVVCLLAACLCAGFVSEAGAAEPHPDISKAVPGITPKEEFLPGAPCPDNLTLEEWVRHSTLWRDYYSSCRPKGAFSAHYKYSKQDMEQFLLHDALALNPNKGRLTFDTWAPQVCIMTVTIKKPVKLNARDYAEDLVKVAARFFRLNGRSPGAEPMVIAARVFTEKEQGKDLYALYDPDTGEVLYGRIDAWK